MTAVAIAAAIVLLAALVVGYSKLMDRRAQEAWATTEGVIVESRVEARSQANADRPGIRYGARIGYEYAVDGRRYRSERVSHAGTLWRPTPDAAEADRARYAMGQSVRVRYDPRDPSQAVLDAADAPRP